MTRLLCMRLGTGPSGTTLESLHIVRRVAPISGEHLVVRRETGKEEAVRVHCDEGVANHVGPEPCAGNREGVGEAERVNDFETAFCLV